MPQSNITNTTVVHGFAMTPADMWFPWIKERLEAAGLAVTIPAMPNPRHPEEVAWRSVLDPIAATWTPDTLVIAHSVGGALVVRLLSEGLAPQGIGGLILVGSPYSATRQTAESQRFFSRPLDWAKIRTAAGAIAVIHAQDDPRVPVDHALHYGESLHVTPHITLSGGHFIDSECPPLFEVLREKKLVQSPYR